MASGFFRVRVTGEKAPGVRRVGQGKSSFFKFPAQSGMKITGDTSRPGPKPQPIDPPGSPARPNTAAAIPRRAYPHLTQEVSGYRLGAMNRFVTSQ